MAEYDADTTYTQSLDAGWVCCPAEDDIPSRTLVQLTRGINTSGWMIAAMRSEFGPLLTSPCTRRLRFLLLLKRSTLPPSDARELNKLSTSSFDKAIEDNDKAGEANITKQINSFETHICANHC